MHNDRENEADTEKVNEAENNSSQVTADSGSDDIVELDYKVNSPQDIDGSVPVPDIIGNNTGDEEVHDSVYGVSRRSRFASYYVFTAIIMIVMISGAFTLAIYMPGDEAIVNSRAELLRQDEGYKALRDKRDNLEYETNRLKAGTDAKRANIDALNNYDNTMAELRIKIEEKKTELSDLAQAAESKQAELEGINNAIEQKAGSVLTLSAGKYVVGTNLPEGKYSVVGTGLFQAATADGISKANQALTSEPYEIELNKGDVIKLENTVKFTPAG